MGLVHRHAHLGVVVGMILAAGVVGCSGNTATPAFGYQTPAIETLAPTLAPTAVRTAAELPTQASGPTAPQPPFTQAQADLCHTQLRTIVNTAEIAGNSGGFAVDRSPASREVLLQGVTTTLDAMTTVQTSGADLLEPILYSSITTLQGLRERLSQPMTADELSAANLDFWYAVAQIDDQEWWKGFPNQECQRIDAWVAANVKK